MLHLMVLADQCQVLARKVALLVVAVEYRRRCERERAHLRLNLTHQFHLIILRLPEAQECDRRHLVLVLDDQRVHLPLQTQDRRL